MVSARTNPSSAKPEGDVPVNIQMNRYLDTLVAIVIVVIGLTLGGATAVLGA